MYHIIALTIGYLLDLIIGDPMNFPHPIRLIGSFISKLDHKFMDEKVKEKNREA
jgi:adenosylcobinamide-phosphate synthase